MSQPSYLAGASSDAKALYDAGDSPGARRLLTEAIDAARPMYGEDHPDLLATAHLLARLHREADDPTAARRVLEEALAAGEHRWGDSGALMLGLSFDLATVADELGNRHEARKNFARVASAGPAVLGADHWTVQAARDYLGAAAAPAPQPTDQTFGPAPTEPEHFGYAQPSPQGSPPAPPHPAEPEPFGYAQPTRPAPYHSTDPTPVQITAPPVQHTVAPFQDSAPPGHDTRTRVDGTGLGSYPIAGSEPFPPPAVAYPMGVSDGTPPGGPPAQAASRGRGAVIAASVAAAAAVLAAAVVVVVALAGSRPPPSSPDAAPTEGPDAQPSLVGEPPTSLRLRDNEASITISWKDPSGGTVPFVVAGGRAGQTLGAMATVNPGETSFTVNGLNSRLDYCFTVLAVYGTDQFSTSGQVCTSRATTPTPR
nr:tetratricopeptide repeat protein [Micromonospora sp. DSM 115978]